MTGWSPYQYTLGRAPTATSRISTSPTELTHLFIAAGVLTIDVALILDRGAFFPASGRPTAGAVLFGLGFGAAAALTGFVAHELAHKISAQRRGFWAEFRMSPMGLVLSLVTATVGFLFAAPGATVIGGGGDDREWGRTSLAGPTLNLVEGGIFYVAAIGVVSGGMTGPLIGSLASLAFVNGWFSAFNLLPFGPLDGRKVLRWNSVVWGATFAVAAAFTVVTLFLGIPRL